MHTTLLLALLTTTTLALPRPQAFLTGIPSVFLPSPYPGCIGGMPCPLSFMRESEDRQAREAARKAEQKAQRERQEVQRKKEEQRKKDEQKKKEEQRKKGSLRTRQDQDSTEDEKDDKEEEAGVFYCQHTHWGGECTHATSPLGSAPEDCTLITLEASSIGPDLGYFCVFYTNALCAPLASDGMDTLTLSFPGVADLRNTQKGDFNDRLLSYQCFREEEISVS